MDGGEIGRTYDSGKWSFGRLAHVVGWLRENGVAILALSYDTRYTDRPEAWTPVASVIRECESQGQPYQVVCTGVGRRGAFALCDHLTNRAGISPNRLVPMEMIDIGGASGQDGKPLRWSSVLELGYCVPCEGKGFSGPTILHISPDRGVRTCLYALGGGWMGNVNRESLLDIVNRFPENTCRGGVHQRRSRVLCGNGHQAVCPRLPLCRSPLCGVGGSCRAIEAASEPNAVPSTITTALRLILISMSRRMAGEGNRLRLLHAIHSKRQDRQPPSDRESCLTEMIFQFTSAEECILWVVPVEHSVP